MKISQRMNVFHILFLLMLFLGYMQTYIPTQSEIQRISDKLQVKIADGKQVYVKQEGYRKWYKMDKAYIQVSNTHSRPTMYTRTYTNVWAKGKQELLLALPTQQAKEWGLTYPKYDRNDYEKVQEKPIMTVGNTYQLEYALKWQKTNEQAKTLYLYGVIVILYVLLAFLYTMLVNNLSKQTILKYAKPYHRITKQERKLERLSEEESILRARGIKPRQPKGSTRKVVSRPTATRGQGVERKYRGLSEEEIRLRKIGEERRRNTRL